MKLLMSMKENGNVHGYNGDRNNCGEGILVALQSVAASVGSGDGGPSKTF